MILRRKLAELSLRRMDIDRWAVVYLLISAFYPVLKPSVFPDPWLNGLIHGVLALAVWFLPPLLRGSRFFLPRLLGDVYLPLLFPMFYAEMEYLGLIFFDFENSLDPALIRIEEWMFGFQPSVSFRGRWLVTASEPRALKYSLSWWGTTVFSPSLPPSSCTTTSTRFVPAALASFARSGPLAYALTENGSKRFPNVAAATPAATDDFTK